MIRRPNLEDITTARLWAEAHCGDDDPLDVMEWKMLQMWGEWHGDTAAWHAKKQDEADKRLAELESRFKVEAAEEF